MVSTVSTLADLGSNNAVQFPRTSTLRAQFSAHEQAQPEKQRESAVSSGQRQVGSGRTFVGRAPQLAAVGEGMAGGEWQGAVVVGPGGIGKTALIKHYLTQTPTSTISHYLRGTALTAQIPYGILGLLLGRNGPRNVQKLALSEVVRSLSRNLDAERAEGTPIIVVDDAEFADPWSALALSELVQAKSIHLILLCRRVNGIAPEFTRLWRTSQLLRVDMPPMSAGDARELVCNEAQGRCSLAAGTALWQKSSGNPLHLKALVHQAISDGALVSTDDIWVWRPDQLGAAAPMGLGPVRRLMNASRAKIEIVEMVAVSTTLPVATLMNIYSFQELDELLECGDLVYSGSGRSSVRVGHPVLAEVLPLMVSKAQSRELFAIIEGIDPMKLLSGDILGERIGWAVKCGEMAVEAQPTSESVEPEGLVGMPMALQTSWASLAERGIVGAFSGIRPEYIRNCTAAQAKWAADQAEMLAMGGLQDEALVLARALAARLELTEDSFATMASTAAVPEELATPLLRIYTVVGEWGLLSDLLSACHERGLDADPAGCIEFELSSGLVQAFQGHHLVAAQLVSQGAAQLKHAGLGHWEALARIAKQTLWASLDQPSGHSGNSDGGHASQNGVLGPEELMTLGRLLKGVVEDGRVPGLLCTIVQCLLGDLLPTAHSLPIRPEVLRTDALPMTEHTDLPVQRMLFLGMQLDGSDAEVCDEVLMTSNRQEGALAEVLGVYAKGMLAQDSAVLLQVVERACQMNFPSLSTRAADKALEYASASSVRGIRRQLQRLIYLPADLSEPARELNARLTEREEAVGLLAAKGASNKEIAHSMSVSVRTVEGHLYQVYAKLQVTSRTELVPLLRKELI